MRSKTFIITQKYVVVVGCVFVCIYMFFNQEKKIKSKLYGYNDDDDEHIYKMFVCVFVSYLLHQHHHISIMMTCYMPHHITSYIQTL